VTPTEGPQEASNITAATANRFTGNRFLLAAIAVLAVAGIVLSGVSLQRHYAKSASTFCEFGEKFDCDIVNRSEYSTVMGIPVAGIGIAGYGLLFVLATVYRSHPGTPTRLLVTALSGLAFALYLTYVEGYVLNAWCILCLSSLGSIVAIALLAGVMKAKGARSRSVSGERSSEAWSDGKNPTH
jgi:vitamin-K-epoxide reductase (warfarin-sensitive)